MSRLPDPYQQAGERSAQRRRRPAPVAQSRPSVRTEWEPARPPLSIVPENPLPADAGRARRALNVAVAIVGLVVSMPLLVLIAAAVKLTSPGPAIYVQTRVGRDRRSASPPYLGDQRRVDLGGRPFRILKFRTMYDRSGARPRVRQVWTRRNDRRITPVGRVLRAFRLDELPQLVNVLRGEMNLVGPRPEQPEIFARLRERLERYPERQRVLPGITGLAQVHCGYGGTTAQVQRKLECDLAYVARCSTLLDLEILLRTVPVVLTRRGAR